MDSNRIIKREPVPKPENIKSATTQTIIRKVDLPHPDKNVITWDAVESYTGNIDALTCVHVIFSTPVLFYSLILKDDYGKITHYLSSSGNVLFVENTSEMKREFVVRWI